MAAHELLEHSGQGDLTITMKVIRWIAILYAFMHIYTAGFGSFPDMIQRSLHVTFAVVLALSLYSSKRIPKVFDLLMIVGIVVSFYWIVINYSSFVTQIESATTVEVVIATITILALLEASRRVMGVLFPILVSLFLLYGLFGEYVPGAFRNAGYSIEALTEKLYMGTSGLWGTTTSITATTVATFIIFGIFLLRCGGAKAFVDIGMKLAGRSVAGPAKVATVSSALFGLFSGSAAANASVVGNFTIKMMIRLGFKREYAAGVEAAASSGGQIAPPIMGASAFIMAEFLGVPYTYIAIAAIVPAFLYFFTLFLALHYDGKRENHQGIPDDMIPKTSDILKVNVLLPFLVPVIAIIVFLSLGFTEARAGFWAIVSSVVIYVFEDFTWKNMRERIVNLLNVLEEAGKAVVMIALLAAASEIMVAILSLTGLGVKITGYLVAVSGSSLFLAVILAGIVVIFLGLGLPTTASYVIGASVVAPALINMDVLPIAAHMFILYYAVVAGITPPICAGVFIAAGLAQAKWFPSSLIACKLGIAKFIVPIGFIYSTGVLLHGELSSIILSITMFTLGSWILTMGISKYIYTHTKMIESSCLIVCGLLAFTPSLMLNLIGLTLAIVVVGINRKRQLNSLLIDDTLNTNVGI